MRLRLLFSLLLLICLPSKFGGAETIDDLKGLSIEVIFDQTSTYRVMPDSKYITGTYRKTLKAYVSSAGNIFDYADFGRTTNKNDSYRITSLNRANEQNFGGMYAWTFLDGHLTRVHQMLEGIRVLTIEIDVRQMVCKFVARDERDPKTGRIQAYGQKGKVLDIYSRTIHSYTCKVGRGNVFASNQ
jgi:hypothetical protein